LGETGDTEEETVAACEDGEEETVDGFMLADDDFGYFVTQGVVFLFEEV
jgi:hypothetical protein